MLGDLSPIKRSRAPFYALVLGLVEEVKRRVETTGHIDAALAEISAINLELLARGELA
jgi:hypothetical protein